MKHFFPHALILLALVALAADTLPEELSLGVLLGAHLAAPVWSAIFARRDTKLRAFLLGPGLVIGGHAIALLLTLLSTIGGVPEDTWITLMLVMIWAVALAAYTAYCALAFVIVTRLRGTK